MTIQFVLDNDFRAAFTNPTAVLSEMMCHAQAFLNSRSLGTTVRLTTGNRTPLDIAFGFGLAVGQLSDQGLTQ